MNYYEYIQSPTWKALAKQVKERDGYKCRICNSELGLEAHHRSYRRLGRTGEEKDLTTLCHRCHKAAEERLPNLEERLQGVLERLPTQTDEELWALREQWLDEVGLQLEQAA